MASTPTGSPTYPLDVVAALSRDAKALLLSIVNPTEEEQEFSPRIAGVELSGPGKLWQIVAPSVNTTNEVGKKPAVEILEYLQPALPERVRVPPISVNVYEFRIVRSKEPGA